mmetsp:Transcript_9367/g.19160  ORF Transcript_9367/g.19160 Transcript_9367/m.19160 type:complete len:95 (-) Transcript_9367:1340-1624(-)
MVGSIGWNPFFQNSEKTIEANLLHEFDQDFYGSELRLIFCGYIRPERDFESLEALKDAIRHDQQIAWEACQLESCRQIQSDEFLLATGNGACEQ